MEGWAVQGLIFCLTATSIYAAVTPETPLFAWHPVLMTLAFPCLSLSAVNAMRQRRLKAHNLHQLLQLAAMVCAIAGMVVMYFVKESKGKPHWWTAQASLHARLGAGAAIVFTLMALGSIVVLPAQVRINRPPPPSSIHTAHQNRRAPSCVKPSIRQKLKPADVMRSRGWRPPR